MRFFLRSDDSGNIVGSYQGGAPEEDHFAFEVSADLFHKYMEAVALRGEHQVVKFDPTGYGRIYTEDLPEVPCRIDGLNITGLPAPCSVVIQDVGAFDVHDGTAELVPVIPGKYKVTISADGFKPKEFSIDAN